MAKAKTTRAGKPTPAAKPDRLDEAAIAAAAQRLIGEATSLCESIDTLMAQRKGDVDWGSPRGAIGKTVEKYEDIAKKLADALSGNPEPSRYWTDTRAADERLAEELTVQGSGSSWARPARFLIWASYVPVLCEWPGARGGYRVGVSAVDPKLPWLTATGNGALVDMTIKPSDRSPVGLCQRLLAENIADKRFDLHDLTPYAAKVVKEAAGDPENAWIAAALAAGRPADSLPLPLRFQSIRQSMNIVFKDKTAA